MVSPLQDDRFLLLSALGQGGSARVFRAFDRIEQRVVALKVQTRVERAGPAHPLSTEFDLWTRVKHPNVVEAIELGVARGAPLARGTPYLVLEHVDGPPLHRSLDRRGAGPRTFERLGAELLAALHEVHETGLVHRDVKPGNILLDRRGLGPCRAKLTDFGLATVRGAAAEPGRISGSLPYVSPEAVLGQRLDGRADLYSLGIVLYRVATGELPVRAACEADLLRWHLYGPPADPRRCRPRFPRRLARLVRSLTMRDRDQRPACAGAALAMLGRQPGPRSMDEPYAGDRSTRATLRLALDATRLGARRLVEVPAGSPEATRRLRAWAQVFGLGFHDLRVARDRGGARLAQLVLRVAVEIGPEGERLLERHSIDRWLPLTRIAGVRVVVEARGASPLPEAAVRAICRFLIEASTHRGMVLLSESGQDPASLPGAVGERLRRRFERPGPPATDRGGLLLVVA